MVRVETECNLGSLSGRNRVFKVVKHPNVLLDAVGHDLGLPLAALFVPADTCHSGSVGRVHTHVLGILRVRDVTQIADPVVQCVAILVIDDPCRP